MTDEITGIGRIRETLGELALGRSDLFVMRTWLKALIESAVHRPKLSSFAPFQEYFVNQQPLEDQLESLLSNEFSSPITGTDETQLTTFRLALAEHLVAPLSFTTRVDDRLVLSDIYRTLFAWFANADLLQAIDTASAVTRDNKLSALAFASSQPLALFLFQTLDAQLATKTLGRAFYEAVFRFALESPAAVAANIPDILEAYICALGDNEEVLFRVFCDSPKLEVEYRNYLANKFPKLLVKREIRFSNRIKAALPYGFPAYLEAMDDARFARIRCSDIVSAMGISRPDAIAAGIPSTAIGDLKSADPTSRHTPLSKPRNLNEAAEEFGRRMRV